MPKNRVPLFQEKTKALRELKTYCGENLLESYVVTDSSVYALYKDTIESFAPGRPVFHFPAGEPSKTLTTTEQVYRFLFENSCTRQGLLIAFGGGVVGDLVGFVAATFMRGISYCLIPTTTVSMADSAFGGKTGLDFGSFKNAIGAFYPPAAVALYPGFLKTLPKEHFNAGFIEVIKHALIASPTLFTHLEAAPTLHANSPLLQEVLQASISIKLSIVDADPEDTLGTRALLNLGHTIGHALEAAGNYTTYLHGQAVAIGIVSAIRLSKKLKRLKDPSLEDRVITLLKKYDLPTELSETNIPPALLQKALYGDKKRTQAHWNFILPIELGKAEVCPILNLPEMVHQLY